ncbi:MAG: 23S rRNA (uracil(1939)-C(5))-methyltransferase RlmD [Deltaproteobacteria bacterium]|jgi:23S rRNA (uracil1939-C5)-methyltransferase|nr:23S rRNA (uracil(1939)-C(5))-methyltransferase RlmD [Deltaproteobacteria bacterium]
MLELSDEIELTVSDLNVDGSAVARFFPSGAGETEGNGEGRRGLVVFVDQGLPGETLLARIDSRKKNIYFARKVRVINPSPYYTEPFCPYFGVCGGCALQNLSYPAQLAFKRQRVQQVLARIGGIQADKPEILPAPALTAYRNKMEYAFGRGIQGGLALGFRPRGGYGVLGVERCPLQSPQTAAVLQAVRAWAVGGGFTAWENGRGALRYLVLREPEYRRPGVQRSAELVCGDALPGAASLGALWNVLSGAGVSSLAVSRRISKYSVARGEKKIKSFGCPTLWEKFGSLLLEFPISGFAQTNTKAAGALYAQAALFAGLTGGEILWDIYSGSGALALYLGDKCQSVWGVDLDREAVESAAGNAARMGFRHCLFEAGDAGTLMRSKTEAPDIIVVDPPRAGLSGAVLAGIKKAFARKIIYISCDAATLARDVSLLASGNNRDYKLAGLVLADLFPHTPHVESVALLIRNR